MTPKSPARSTGSASPTGDRAHLLFGGSPRQVLARLVRGDPLGVRERVAGHLRAGAFLLDADRVHLRALALCARYGRTWRGRPALDAWLDVQVERGIREILREEARAVSTDPAPGSAGGPDPPPAGCGAHSELARPLGLEARDARAACDAFHRQSPGDREAFFRAVIERASLDDLARAEGVSVSEVARRARRALDAVLGALPSTEAPTPTKDGS